MTYQAPYIDNTGLHTNSYNDILAYYIDGMKNIYGSDIYLEPDSGDYQMLSIFARAIYESEQCAQMNYQARSPVTATTDDALDALVTINGLKRKSASYSTANVTLTGTPFTQITGGVVQSTAGDKWNLPNTVIISSSGTTTVVATAQEIGQIKADANTITQIVTPTYGWQSVTNQYPASIGQSVETLSQLRARQQAAVALPSQTPKEGVESALYSTEGVTDFVVYENDEGGEIDYDTSTHTGGPGHSITCVVEGGDDNEIAKVIDLHKTPGCYTTGDIVISVVDKYGSQNNIRFYRPEETSIYTTLTIKALSGYSSSVADSINENIVNYLSQLTIGDNLYVSQIWDAALSVSPDIRPYVSLRNVTIGTSSSSQATNDLIADFNEKFITSTNNITITLQS